MKDYRNVAEDVFRRSGEIIEQNKRRRKTVTRVGTSACCIAAAGAVGFGVWRASQKISTPDNVLSETVSTVGAGQGAPVRGGVTQAPNTSAGGESTESAQPVQENSQPASVMGGTNAPLFMNEEEMRKWFEENPVLTHVEGIKADGADVFDVPSNGELILTDSLKRAMERYGDEDGYGEVYYRLYIEYYKDGEKIDPTKELYESELERYKGRGLGFETYSSDWGAHVEHRIFMMPTGAQIKSIVPNEEYGCVLHLYFNYHGDYIDRVQGSGYSFEINGAIR